jgi:glycosyltransferase involved in cell wall biosynthesis
VDEIRPYLWKATVAVVPLVYGAGIQNKILEAMACGTPVVTTTRATFSLQGRLDNEILIADAPDEFSSNALHLIDDLGFRSRSADLGFGYVKKFYDWNKIGLQLTDIYRKTIYNFDVPTQK